MHTMRGASRRDLLTCAVGALAAAAVAGSPVPAGAAQPAAGTPWSAEYWARKGAVQLYLYRKRAGVPPRADGKGATLPVLFLVHGSSFCGRSTYDLTVPGAPGYSMMDVFAGLGYDVWTLDHEGYGRSSRTAGNSDIASGVADLAAAMEVVRRETGAERAHFHGESSGAIRCAAYASAAPERIDRLALSAFTYTGEGAPTLAQRTKDVAFYRTHNRRPAGRELYRSIFTRDKAGTADPRVGDAIADAEAPYGDSVPTGTYLDMVTKLPLVDPAKVLAPVLMLRGEYDGISTEDDCLAFYRRLPNRDRQFVTVPGSAHSLVLGYNRARFWHALDAFLRPPAREDRLG
jgi:alpha-beta hydrolase superfamily lysophospholipase